MTVAVAMCTRNGATYVAAQLGSIVGGTRMPDELVVVDDASTDDTATIVEAVLAQIASDHPQLSVRWERNPEPLGVTANFERAISLCGSDIVILCDQDDLWHRDRVAAAVERFESEP